MNIHWKPFVRVSWDGYPFWGIRVVLSVLIGMLIGTIAGAIILAVEL